MPAGWQQEGGGVTKMSKLKYIKDASTGIEIIVCENANISYPKHTHISHLVIGIVTEGIIGIRADSEEYRCHKGQYYFAALNMPHSLYPISGSYSMINLCIPREDNSDRELEIIRKEVIKNPELKLSIADMSEKACISSYHMIRKFTAENGLTPHKFQLQCRIRKAKDLLIDGMGVADAAAETGFCDQSHLDRVFKKQVGISPEEYAKSAILSKP